MIRVLHFAGLINRYDFIDSVLTKLDRDKFEVSALTLEPPNNRTGKYAPNEEYETTCLNIRLNVRSARSVFAALVRRIRQFRPDILQAHHYNESLIAALASRYTGVPVFVIGHHYSDHIYQLTRGPKRRFYLTGEAIANYFADKIVVPSQEVVDLLGRRGDIKNKIVKIPYGTDVTMVTSVDPSEAERLRTEYGLQGKFVGLTTCRLNKEKGLEHLIHAVDSIRHRFPQFRLIMAGSGREEDFLRSLVTRLGLDDVVKFIGWRTDTLNWIVASDLVFQPSISESFCQVLVESLLLERPIVMTPVGAGPEVIVNGERGGYLVPIGSSAAIADAICRAIEFADERHELALRGKEFVQTHYTTEVTAGMYEEMYLASARANGLTV